MKKVFLLLSAVAALSSSVQAQFRCATDEVNNKAKELYPEIAQYEAQLRAEINAQMTGMNFSQFAKTTDINDNVILHVPIVFHIVHDYAGEYISDNDIFDALADINRVFSKSNSDTAHTIPTFAGNIPGTNVRYMGNPKIQFHLAQKDPSGNPTKGITRNRSYLTYAASDQAKGSQWPPQSYMNIWIIRKFNANHASAGAYAYKPGAANSYPIYFWDGVICLSGQMIWDHTLSHELAHTFNIDHVWGSTNQPEKACGDDDVDDTPPTKGHMGKCGATELADTNCSVGYVKVYDTATARHLFNVTFPSTATNYVINYPDTNNTQNIMDYSGCGKMFTYLQTVRMRASLRSSAANRNNLIDSANLKLTGVMNANGNILPLADLPPNADFSTNNGTRDERAFVCLGSNVNFANRSWNDTITTSQWTFTDATNAVSTASTNTLIDAVKSFNNPGWVKVQLTANSNAGSGTITKDSAIYVANNVAKSAVNYFQEFSPTDDMSEYPMFNIYNNTNKWQVVNNAGYYDNSSICMNAYDKRTGTDLLYNSPIGDYDEFYTPAFDLTSFASGQYCNLSFMIAGAAATSNPNLMLDTLEISYMTNCSGVQSWKVLKKLTKLELFNAGTIAGKEFVPTSGGAFWANRSYNIPVADRQAKVYFRFRYKSNGDIASNGLAGTANNVYLDRLYFNGFPTGVDEVRYQANGFALAPNPSTGSSFVMIKGTNSTTPVKIQVTDVTGKSIFATEAVAMNDTKVEIPANVVNMKGIYMVTVTTGTTRQTEKLVIY